MFIVEGGPSGFTLCHLGPPCDAAAFCHNAYQGQGEARMLSGRMQQRDAGGAPGDTVM